MRWHRGGIFEADRLEETRAGTTLLEVVARVGEVEALVGEREVGNDGVGERDRQRGPVEERRVDDLAPRDRAGAVDLDPVDDACLASPRRCRVPEPPRCGCGDALTLEPTPADASLASWRERGADLVDAHGEPRHHVAPGFGRTGELDRRVRTKDGPTRASIGEPDARAHHAERADGGGVLSGEHGGPLEAVHDDGV